MLWEMILPLCHQGRQKEEGGRDNNKEPPKENVMDWCRRVYFASWCRIFGNSDFPHRQALASEMMPSSLSENTLSSDRDTAFHGMQIKHTWMDFIMGIHSHKKPGSLVSVYTNKDTWDQWGMFEPCICQCNYPAVTHAVLWRHLGDGSYYFGYTSRL